MRWKVCVSTSDVLEALELKESGELVPCSGGSCPTVYVDDNGDVVLQGYESGSDRDSDGNIHWPEEFVKGLSRQFESKKKAGLFTQRD